MISREDLVTQSVQTYARAAVIERGYDPSKVDFRESFPYEMNAFDRTVIACGFNFDDDGTPAEMGSDLTRREYHIEFFVFGFTNTYGRNVANVLKFCLERDGAIPLLDIAQSPAVQIDSLPVLGVSAERQIVPEPEPFQEFLWTTHLRVEDFYFSSLV